MDKHPPVSVDNLSFNADGTALAVLSARFQRAENVARMYLPRDRRRIFCDRSEFAPIYVPLIPRRGLERAHTGPRNIPP